MPEDSLNTSGFEAAFGIVFALVLAVFALAIVLAVVNVQKVRRAGHNPATLETDLAVRALDSEVLAPRRSKEERLRELDDLRARGAISAEEHGTARADVLSAP